MLKLRVITALWLLPLAMVAIFALPAQWFLILMGVILLGGSWEYKRLAGLAGLMAGHLMVLLQALSIFQSYQHRKPLVFLMVLLLLHFQH